jgi:hypothetical protein
MLEKTRLFQIYREHVEGLTGRAYSVKCALDSRGWPYYGVLGKVYPHHLSSFKNVQKRVVELSLPCDFEHTVDGFIDFLVYLGDVPPNMVRPSVGRIDHKNGYVRENFRWECLSENSSEGSVRKTLEGKTPKGEKSPTAKVSNDDVKAIRNFRDLKMAEGWSMRKIGRAIRSDLDHRGVSMGTSTIYYILSGKTFKEV